MTREDIARHVSNQTGNTLRESRDIVGHVVDAIVKGLSEDGRVEIRGLGSWSVRVRKAREARKPRTGEKIQLPERKVPFFRASDKLKEEVNRHDPGRSPDNQDPEGRDGADRQADPA